MCSRLCNFENQAQKQRFTYGQGMPQELRRGGHYDAGAQRRTLPRKMAKFEQKYVKSHRLSRSLR